MDKLKKEAIKTSAIIIGIIALGITAFIFSIKLVSNHIEKELKKQNIELIDSQRIKVNNQIVEVR